MRADAEVEVPGATAPDLHREVAVEQRQVRALGEASLEDGALDARAEDDVLPVVFEELPRQGQERRFGGVDGEVLGTAAVEVIDDGAGKRSLRALRLPGLDLVAKRSRVSGHGGSLLSIHWQSTSLHWT
jgi:hypothetical protein